MGTYLHNSLESEDLMKPKFISFLCFLLILTLDSYAEPFLLILCLVGAVILNAGTNIVMGTVSTMTNIAASVLQMAVSVDYFIFILHRYREFREEYEDPEEAMVQALRKSRSSVLASSVTTVIWALFCPKASCSACWLPLPCCPAQSCSSGG